MKELEKEFTRKGFKFTQLDRTDKKAIYRQTDVETGILIGHEIFYIKISKEWEVAGNIIPESEAYPGDNQFGVTAWSVGRDIERATKKYNSL